jgi:ATP-dependent Lhr-like helicase
LIGTINEDFAIESNQGDIFQLGTTSWQILKLEPGILRVVSAKGAPPTLPFWLGEAPARSAELSQEYAGLRETCAVLEEVGRDAVAWLMDGAGVPKGAAEQIRDYVVQGRKDLGASPSQKRIVIERFFDESGGAQLVVHCPFGGRINRAYGLALRKRFCRGFGFELQAAANEDAILLSLGPQHSFPLEEVFDYLNSKTARELLIQALLAAPMFTTRWRWNVTRALVVPRSWGGKRVPSPILRMRATDALVAAFPQAEACFETLPPGDMEVPLDHPLVRQTIEDCLNEAMDIEGFLGLLRGLEDGSIERVAVDTPEPSVFALAILNANPYAFLDDAPLEERRAQAVSKRRGLSPDAQDTVGALDPAAIERVRGEVWPEPVTAEEVHEVLTWMGYVTSAEAPGWLPWLEALHAAQRVDPEQVDGETRWFAAEASRDPLEVWRGRLEVLGPIQTNDAELFALENEGVAMRVRYEGKSGWCHRRLLARIQRYTLNALRREIEPVTAAVFWRFLAAWQHATPERQLEGPQGTYEVIQQLAGFEAPAAEWERSILPARVRNYRRSFLDDLTLSGRVAWGRLWSAGAAPVRTTPLCLLPRDDLDGWLGLAGVAGAEDLVGGTGEVYRLLKERGAQFAQDLQRRARLLPEHFEGALGELITRGLVSSDSYAGLRALVVTPAQRRYAMPSAGRWSLFRDEELDPPPHEELCRALLRRTGVVFKRTQAREKLPVPWRELHRTFRHLELRGEVRGGRFVSGFSGEQFALPEAIRLMRKVRKIEDPRALSVSAADPLNYQGILTPAEKVARTAKRQVVVVG